MKKKILLSGLLIAGLTAFSPVEAQRMYQPLGRGVVATSRGSDVLITWRKLAQEPENAQYNVYYRTSASAAYQKLNSSPISVSNLKTTTSVIKSGYQLAVALVVDGVEQALSKPWTYRQPEFDNVFFSIDFAKSGSPVSCAETTCKFVWPVDLDGDGEYDYVVDRRRTTANSDKLEGYLADGTHLWTVEVGPNIMLSTGQNDMVCVADLDCDGKAEVVFQASDSTRFWDATNKTWGKWLNGCPTADSDGDGIINYTLQKDRNPPHYIAVIDGMTGAQKACLEMTYPSDKHNTYTRDNKSDYMGDEYSYLMGKMGVAYLDGIHPSIVMEYCNRTTDGNHHYYTTAYGYDFSSGQAGTWKELWTFSFCNQSDPRPNVFHHIRIGDVDGDGKDEVLNGAMCIDDDGTMLWDSRIAHGDRFRLSDIDPDRPGQEIFAIQQNAGDMLGQILYDARTGESIKRWYLGTVGDVGRGECMDVLPEHKGYEMWSTMPNMYTAKGDVAIAGTHDDSFTYPTEGMWWDGELDREIVNRSGGNNIDIRKFNYTSAGNRLIQMSRESGWRILCEDAIRGMFWGDIYGDWREEIILRYIDANGHCTGIYGYTTNYPTAISNIYCLQQDPNYRGQCTNRGYYQTPNTGFYLGYDMPAPPLPPFMLSDYVWSKTGTTWNAGSADFTDMSRNASQTYADGSCVLFALDGAETVNVSEAVKPDSTLLIVPSGKTYTFSGDGALAGGCVWKTGEGRAIFNIPLTTTQTTYISEGTLELNSTMSGNLDLRARGTLAGNVVVAGQVALEGALHKEGGRFQPGTEDAPFGTIRLLKDFAIDHLLVVDYDVQSTGVLQHDVLMVEGDVTLTDSILFNIVCHDVKLAGGEYPLLQFTGTFTGAVEKIGITGLIGLPYEVLVKDGAVMLVIKGQRNPSQDVVWTGVDGSSWDYETENFVLDGDAVTFVADDHVMLNDEAENTTITLSDQMPIGGVTIQNESKTYTIEGDGGWIGTGGLTKNGAGTLYLNANKHTYTGPTILNQGKVYITEFSESGLPSSIGAASADAQNLQLGNVHVVSTGLSASTDHAVTLLDTASLEVPESAILSFKGQIVGDGTLVKKGAGQLGINYAGSNTWTGGIVVEEGTLSQGGTATTFGPVGSKLTFKNGRFVQFYATNSGSAPSFNYTVEVPEADDSFEFVLSGRTKIQGKWLGKGNTTFNSTYVRGDVAADFSDYEGTITTGGDNEFRFVQNVNMKKGRLVVNQNVCGYKAGGSTKASYEYHIGSITGTGNVQNGKWYVGYDNSDFTFDGLFVSVPVYKYGEGTMQVSRTNASSFYIHEGTFYFSNKANTERPSTGEIIAYGPKATIQAGAGYVRNVTINDGATYYIGNYGVKAVRTINMTGNLTVNNSTIVMHRNRIGNDKLVVTAKVALTNPIIQLDIVLGDPWQAGDTLDILDFNPEKFSMTGSLTIKSDLAEGLYWDTTEFAETGVLRVKSTESAIDKVWYDEAGNPIIYDMAGRKVETPEVGKMYLINGKKTLYRHKQ